jgi:hypothetical protein
MLPGAGICNDAERKGSTLDRRSMRPGDDQMKHMAALAASITACIAIAATPVVAASAGISID